VQFLRGNRKHHEETCDLRLVPWYKWDLHCSGILHSICWYFVAYILGKPIGPIFKGQAIQVEKQERVGWSVKTRVKEHFQLIQPDKLVVVEHIFNHYNLLKLQGTQILCTKYGYIDELMREAIELELHPTVSMGRMFWL